jgi:hypothetical protein
MNVVWMLVVTPLVVGQKVLAWGLAPPGLSRCYGAGFDVWIAVAPSSVLGLRSPDDSGMSPESSRGGSLTDRLAADGHRDRAGGADASAPVGGANPARARARALSDLATRGIWAVT